jgi:hypothetical protein
LKKRFWTAADEHGNPVVLWGYGWRVPRIKPGQRQRISVHYTIDLSQYGGRSRFTYFLRSGAQWDGPLGRETVTVATDKGLRTQVLSPVVLKPVESSTDSITWEISDAKPDEDIEIEISPKPKQ